MSGLLQQMQENSPFFDGNAPFLEDLYEAWLKEPTSIPLIWRDQFAGMTPKGAEADSSHRDVITSLLDSAREKPPCAQGVAGATLSTQAASKQASVLRLINAYRVRGHQNARLDPLNLNEMVPLDELQLRHHKLSEGDLETRFNTGSLIAPDEMPLKEILKQIQQVYTGTVGSEYMHITSTEEKRWIQQRLESTRCAPDLSKEDRLWLLRLLSAAEGLEKYLHNRYVGQKRFSLEGGESLIPLLDELIQRAGSKGVHEVVIGMAHRGRLNVLTNILGKPPTEIYQEFTGALKLHSIMTSGDVKYHKGFSSDLETPGGIIHVALGFNPSHLEIINPVIEGSVRARQQRRHDKTGAQVMAILIHGDAAFAGQGVVMETLNLSQARGFSTGGTVHIVINNQIGFTLSDPLDSRSTTYCTDVAKMIQAPIFHVNGDDPEAVIFVTRLALDYRNHFHKDVVIDLVCYRRHGHNEADEPAVTQPIMYQKIALLAPTRALYAEKLISQGLLSPDDARQMVDHYRDELDQGQIVSRPVLCEVNNIHKLDWHKYLGKQWDQPVDTSLPADSIRRLGRLMTLVPDDFNIHPRVTKILEARRQMMTGDIQPDWGFGEHLAFASLLDAGYPIRMSGQDCRRGTFFHRHALIRDQNSGREWIPLQHLHNRQANITIIDSLLSEEAVLAFEYGYASASPNTLCIWEAQFGDFANGAQVVIDQFITSAGAKWGLFCGLVLMLPHSYEGQGPEHSSARPERYMQLCAEHNIQVCVPSTPAQIFHVLRRQMLRPYPRPLILLTPKSLLRHPLAVSCLDEFTQGRFRTVLDDELVPDRHAVTQVILCCGKVYYDLLQARQARNLTQVALVRMEQLYPFPRTDFEAMCARYPNATHYVWCQEEPQNQGAWDQIKHRFSPLLAQGKQVFYVGRKSAAAPATGFSQLHKEEQEKLVNDALNGNFDPEMNRRTF